jgi:DNA-binding NarL/FixJ family response regulator
MSDPTDRLTAREREVLRLRGRGLGVGEIATRLGISPETARKHRDNAVQRLGTGSEIAAAVELDRAERERRTAPA